ncbi:MAG: hypothetical protein IPQ07_10675 [Myxococcales bacterium]|nr:hypothetical protein [Myxococcales bacterium]
MVTGRLPFEAPTVMALLSKHLLESIVPPSQRRPDLNLPPAIDMLILNAMAKDPNARPATMEQFGEEIAAVLATFPPETGQNTAQATAQATAQQPVQTRSQAAVTPPAYSAAGAAGGPPPGGFAPPVTPPPGGFAPPGAFAPPPPPPGGFAPQTPPPQGGFAPQPSPPQGAFASPASMVAPPYDPHAHAHAPPSATEITRSSGGKGIWVLLGLLVVAGIGTGVYFGVLRKTGKPTPEQPTPGSNVAETPPGTPDAQVETPPPTAPDAAVLDPSNDPWAKGGGSTTVPSNGSNAITDHVGDDTDDDPGGDDEPTPPRAPRPAGQGMPAECEAYAQTLEVMAKCDKLPAQSRDAMKQAVQQMRKTYSSMKLTGAMRKQLVDACVQGDEASKQSIAGLGCSP